MRNRGPTNDESRFSILMSSYSLNLLFFCCIYSCHERLNTSLGLGWNHETWLLTLKLFELIIYVIVSFI
jgi:hypothetical protein